MYKIYLQKFSSNLEERFLEIEKDIIPVYKKVYKWNFEPKNRSDREYQIRGLIDLEQSVIIQKDGKTVGFLAFRERVHNELKYVHIVEIGVVPEERGKGHSNDLRKMLLTVTNPDIIYGEAVNSVSVQSRSSVFEKYGYYTFWAEEPVGNDFKEKDKVRSFSKGSVKIFDPENYDSYIEGCKNFSPFNFPLNDGDNQVKELEPIFRKIEKLREVKKLSIYGVLLSIKKELLLNSDGYTPKHSSNL